MRNVRLLILLVIICLGIQLQAEDKLNILFFGNSFTLNGSAPALVAQLAEIAGHTKPLAFGDLMGGTDLAYHITQVEDYPENNVTNAVIGTNTWDYVVIQGYSTEATHIGNPVTFTNNAQILYEDVKNHPSGQGVGVKAIMFETWARNANHSYYPDTFANPYEMQEEIRTNYWLAVNQINETEGGNYARFADVGDAFERDDFADDLYAADLYHQGGIGTNLIAMVLYRTIYGEDVSDISYTDAVNAGWTTMTGTEWTNLTAYADNITITNAPIAPEPPTLTSPTDGGSTVTFAVMELSATDVNDDDLQYKVEISDSTDFSSLLYTYNQTSSQIGWSGQDALGSTAYASGSTATLTMQTELEVGSTYYWRAAAKDVSGNDEWSTFSVTNSFTITDAEPIYIDCGGADAPSATWNNINFYTLGTSSLIDNTGAASGLSLEITTELNGLNGTGTSSPTGDAAQFSSVGGNSAYGNVGEWSGSYNPIGISTLSGLNTNNAYTLTFFASRINVTDNRQTLYTVVGYNAASNTLDVSNNISEVAVVENIIPTAEGTVEIKVQPGPDNNHSVQFFYLGGIRIDTLTGGVKAPYEPTLYEPSDSQVCSNTPTFMMSATDPNGDALKYKIELSTNENFSTVDYTYDQTVSQTGWTSQDALTNTAYSSGSTGVFTVVSSLDNGIYYWRAYAFDAYGDQFWSNSSDSRVFTVASSEVSPDAPTLISPVDGAVALSIPSFTLSTVDLNLNDIQYKVEVSASSDFIGTIYTYNQNELQAGWENQDADSGTAYASGSTATLVTQRLLDKDTTYYWRATAIDYDGSGIWSAYSETNSFTVASAPIYIDCYGNNAPTATWNNFAFTQAVGTTGDLKNTNGVSSGITIEIITTCDRTSTGSEVASGPAVEFAPAGTGVAYRQNTIPQYDFSGLSPLSSYTFTFFGSRQYSGGDIEVTYSVAGANSGSDYLDASYNATEIAVVSNIYPTAEGEINFSMAGGPLTTYNYSYISAMKIEPNVNVSGMPNALTLIDPVDSALVSSFPILSLSATDEQGDYVVYKIELAKDAGFTIGLQTIDQSNSQIGWMNQDMHGGTVYASGSTALYDVQSKLDVGSTYYWRAYAMDPAGSGEWSLVSAVQTFTTKRFGTTIILR